MAEHVTVDTRSLPGDIGSRVQNTARFLNTGGEIADLGTWQTSLRDHLDKLEADWTALLGKPALSNRLAELTTLLRTQEAIVEQSCELLARKTVWTVDELSTAHKRAQDMFKKHWLAKKLKQRITLDSLEHKLVTSGQETRHEAWKALYTAYKNVNEHALLEPCLNRVHEMLVQMWPAAIQLLVESAEAPSSPTDARFFWNELRNALQRFADLVGDDAQSFAEYTYTTALRDRLNEQLHPKEEVDMKRSTQPGIGDNVISITDRRSNQTLTGNHTAPPKEIPMTTITASEQEMQDFATGSFSDPIRVRDALTLAKPFLTDPDKAKTEGEKALLGRLNTFRENTVDRLERMCAGPGPWQKRDLEWAVANKEILLAALPFFRGDAGMETMRKRFEREPLIFATETLLDLPDGSWMMEEQEKGTKLMNDPRLQGTDYEANLKSRLAAEERLREGRRAEPKETTPPKQDPPTIVAKTTPPIEDPPKPETNRSTAAPWGPIVAVIITVMALVACAIYIAIVFANYRRQRPSPVAPPNAPAISSPVTPAPPAPPGSVRTLTPADFSGNPVNRVPATVVVPGSWAGEHLHCSSPPVTDPNGNTDYSACEYVP